MTAVPARRPAPATRWVRGPGVPWRRTVDGCVLARPADGEPLALSAAAAEIWAALAEPATVDEVACRLAASCGLAAADVRGDVARAVADLHAHGLVEPR